MAVLHGGQGGPLWGGEGVRQAASWWNSIPGRGKSQCEECLVRLRKSKEKASVARAEGSKEEMRGDQGGLEG